MNTPDTPRTRPPIALLTIVIAGAALLLPGCDSAGAPARPSAGREPTALTDSAAQATDGPNATPATPGTAAQATNGPNSTPAAPPGGAAVATPVPVKAGVTTSAGNGATSAPAADTDLDLADIDRDLAGIDTQLSDADRDVATPEGDLR